MKKRIAKKDNIARLELSMKTMYQNKYYNLFMRSLEWGGIDAEQQDYIMRQFWSLGCVAAFKIPLIKEIGFAPFAAVNYNMYDFPASCQLINKRGVPFIPAGTLAVGKEVVLGWIQSNHKSIQQIVNHYIDRIVQVEMVINTNLQTHKMPFLVGVSPNDIEKAKDIVNRILNNEVEVFMDAEDLQLVKSFATNTPYIIDKLYSYKTSLENELLTYLGIDNAVADDTKDRLIVDQVNANNQMINANRQGMIECVQEFVDLIKEVLGFDITVKAANNNVGSWHETEKEETIEEVE